MPTEAWKERADKEWEKIAKIYMKHVPMPDIRTERQLEKYSWRLAIFIEKDCSLESRETIFNCLEEPMRKI